MTKQSVPSAFFWRRMHSFTGAWLAIFIIFHLLTNSQAALLIGNDGSGFIHSVNAIHSTPFLPLVEIGILAVPILIHMIWGIKYLRSAEYNSFGNTGHTPYLPQYRANHAYTWQRITSWLLVVGVIAHVVHMRFIEYPSSAPFGTGHSYMVRVSHDAGLDTLAARLGVTLYTAAEIDKLKLDTSTSGASQSPVAAQATEERQAWVRALQNKPLRPGEVIATADNFGTAELLMVRDTFKIPLMIVLYTLLVLAACFHAFNGLWTFMISWGVTLTERSQKLMRKVATTLMLVVGGLGLAAVWLTYWINLKS
jgi:succinate dehydrogenase / fumarate reductase cytochrome b subunit